VKKIVTVAALFIIAVGFLLLLRGNEDTWICSNGNWVKHGHPSASMPTKPCAQVKTNPTPTINPNANIILESPKEGETIASPFVITGRARVFENQLNFRVRGAKGNSLIEGTMTANASDVGQFGPYEVTISSVPKGKATIEVFDHSPKDGSEIDKVSVEVNVK
jgi:hypothetical protein